MSFRTIAGEHFANPRDLALSDFLNLPGVFPGAQPTEHLWQPFKCAAHGVNPRDATTLDRRTLDQFTGLAGGGDPRSLGIRFGKFLIRVVSRVVLLANPP